MPIEKELIYSKLPLVPAFRDWTGARLLDVRDYPLEQLEQRVTRVEYNTMRTELTVIMPHISPSKWCDPLVANDGTRA